MKLYKYRTINSFSLDIIKNKRLYLTKTLNLNDPYDVLIKYEPQLPITKITIDSEKKKQILSEIQEYNIAEELSNYRVCSLSEVDNSILMWSHYSNGHKGIVFELELNENEIHVVKYVTEKEIFEETRKMKHKLWDKKESEEDWFLYLSHKMELWEYEKECRIIEKKKEYYENVKITKIILGYNTVNNNINDLMLLRDIIEMGKDVKFGFVNITSFAKAEIMDFKYEEIKEFINKTLKNKLKLV